MYLETFFLFRENAIGGIALRESVYTIPLSFDVQGGGFNEGLTWIPENLARRLE